MTPAEQAIAVKLLHAAFGRDDEPDLSLEVRSWDGVEVSDIHFIDGEQAASVYGRTGHRQQCMALARLLASAPSLLRAALREIETLTGWLEDAGASGEFELGRREGVRQEQDRGLALINRLIDKCNGKADYIPETLEGVANIAAWHMATNVLKILRDDMAGRVPDTFPPLATIAEVLRLRAAVRKMKTEAEGVIIGGAGTPGYHRILKTADEVLGEAPGEST